MSEHNFEQIMSAVLEQKQVWERLRAENRELRQQLIDLRAGRGIYLEIQNQRFDLVWEPSRPVSEATEPLQGKLPQAANAVNSQPPSPTPSRALEEMLLDELSLAVKNRMGSESKLIGSLNEEQKANLRRELSGSFLLE